MLKVVDSVLGEAETPSPNEIPVLPNRHALNQFRKLEGTFGKDCGEFWQACATGQAPQRVLEAALGGRHKAAKASPSCGARGRTVNLY
jgi:hypothetical protein